MSAYTMHYTGAYKGIRVYTHVDALTADGYRDMRPDEVRDSSASVQPPEKNFVHISSLRQPTAELALEELVKKAIAAGAEAMNMMVLTNTPENSGHPEAPFLYSGILYVKAS